MEEQELNEKAYRAFWCLYSQAEEKGYNLSFFDNKLVIYDRKQNYNNHKVGRISIHTDIHTHKVKKYFFGHKTISHSQKVIRGYVVNIDKKQVFDFVIRDLKSVEEIAETIMNIGNILMGESIKKRAEEKIKYEAERVQALEEMQCSK